MTDLGAVPEPRQNEFEIALGEPPHARREIGQRPDDGAHDQERRDGAAQQHDRGDQLLRGAAARIHEFDGGAVLREAIGEILARLRRQRLHVLRARRDLVAIDVALRRDRFDGGLRVLRIFGDRFLQRSGRRADGAGEVAALDLPDLVERVAGDLIQHRLGLAFGARLAAPVRDPQLFQQLVDLLAFHQVIVIA